MEQDVPFERIGGYRILRRLATGGTSDVLLARAEGPHGFERTVVLKLLLQQFRRDAPMEKMFAREAAAYARLSHPAIVKLYDFFSAEGQLVMVLEFIDGLPLNRFRAMLRKGGDQLDDRASIFVASRVFAALAAAHGARDPETGEFAPVIHRDVNPSNVLIPWDGHVKLADFGIAKVAGVSSDTQAGFIKGTYGYMAPEQVKGEPVTVRTDVYAASLLLWELLARRKAIQRGALPEMEVLRAMAEPSLPSLDVLRPDLPQRLRDAVSRGLEASPDARNVTADEMLMVLRESVTSNEGRNVLAELLARAKQEHEALRSGPPPNVEPSSPPRGAATPRPPAARPQAPEMPSPKAPQVSEPSITNLSRTALGIGQVPAVTPTGGVRAAAAPPPSTRGALPRSPAPALRPVVQTATPPEGAGAYRSVTGAGRSPPEERLMTAMGVAPPPPHILADTSSIPPALRGSNDATPAPPMAIPTLDASPLASTLQSPLASSAPPGPALGETVRMPTPPPPPPPAAVWAALMQSEQQALMHPPISSSAPPPPAPSPSSAPEPPPPPPPVAQPPIPPRAAPVVPRAFTPIPQIDRGGLREIPPDGASNRGTYALVAGIALVASAAVVAALLFAHRPSASAPVASAIATPTSTPTSTSTPTATPIPTPTSTSTSTPTPTPTSTATPTPTSTPTPTPTPTATGPTPTRPTAAYDGILLTPPRSAGHRVFVDGRYAGDSPGPIHVRCGTHTVKIGSGGVARSVDIPCGGEITVGPR